MRRFHRTAVLAALVTIVGISAVIFAQQSRVATVVTNDVLPRRDGHRYTVRSMAELRQDAGGDALQFSEADR